MNREDIQQLYNYNKWANGKVRGSVAPLSNEQLSRQLGGSFPSVRETLVHILGAEWIWLRRWKGVSPRAFLEPTDFPNLEAVTAKWSEVETEQMDFVRQVTDEALNHVVTYVNTRNQTWEYPLGQVMQHLVNHSSYHRGQVANFLRQLGAQPVSTDFLIYFDEQGQV